MARVEPLPTNQWPPEMRDAMVALAPSSPRHPRLVHEGRPKALNLLGTFAHHPALARAFFTLNGHALLGTTLSSRQREILILRVAHVRNAPYEWAQHLLAAHDAGLDDEEIERIRSVPEAPLWNPLEAALLRAADELVGEGAIAEETWTVLTSELDTQQLLDVIVTVGAYETVAWLLRSFAVDFDDDLTYG
jgi:alkylhydroperoxidase family enzyme